MSEKSEKSVKPEVIIDPEAYGGWGKYAKSE